MLYLFRILLILGIATLKLSSEELRELKNNFYIDFETSQISSFETNANQGSVAQNRSIYGLGYLRQFDDFYLGASLKIFPDDKLNYSVISEDNKNIDIQRERDFLLSLQVKYNFFEFENIKFLFGVDLGYQINSFKLDYTGFKKETIREEFRRELEIGEMIDENVLRQCGFSGGGIGENVIWDPETEKYKVIGKGVYCISYEYVEKEIEYPHSTELMQASIPISLSFTILYGLTHNIDLGLGLGLTLIENININYTDSFIKLNHKQALSYYTVHFLINYKMGDSEKKRRRRW